MPDAPLSWRDVQQAIKDSETRILSAIAAANQDVLDHEKRLRDIEEKIQYLSARENGMRLVLAGLFGAIAAIAGVVAIAKNLGAI